MNHYPQSSLQASRATTSVGRRFILLFGMCVAIFLGLALFAEQQQAAQIRHFKHQIDEEHSLLVAASAHADSQLENAFVDSNSAWDELTVAIRQRDVKWLHQNLGLILGMFNTDAVWVTDIRRKFVYTSTRPQKQNLSKLELPSQLWAELEKPGHFKTFYLQKGTRWLQIVAAGVTTSADVKRRLAPQGFIIAVRDLDAAALSKLSKAASSSKLSIVPVAHDSSPVNSEAWSHVPLRDISGKTIAFIKFGYSTESIASIQAANRNMIAGMIGFGGGIVLLLGYTLFRWVSRPLRLIATSLREDRADVVATLADSYDEYGALARLVIQHQQQINRTRVALQEASLAREAEANSSRAKSEFLANMSHEIRTPMNGIIGVTDLLLTHDLSEESREYVEMVKTSAASLTSLINDILDLSKIEAGKLSLNEIPMDLSALVDEVVSLFQPIASRKEIQLGWSMPLNAPSAFVADPDRLRQVLTNLLGNALKFTATGTVQVMVEPVYVDNESAKIEISVIDSGIGIPEDRLEEVFSSFTQADGSTTRKFGGTGLGLTISRQLVELMGGSIRVESELGKGSKFTVCICLKHQEFVAPSSLPLRVIVVGGPKADADQLSLFLLRSGHSLCDLSSASSADLVMILEESHGVLDFDANLRRVRIGHGPGLVPLQSHRILAALEPEAKVTSTLSQLSYSEQSNRILLVEDNAVNQKVAARMLEIRGYEVEIASNGQLALDAVRRSKFDLILMDVQMPVMDGLAATRALRSDGFTMPVLALTANAMKGDRELCLEAGMDGYVSKPVRAEELYKAIETILHPRIAA